ncbi:metal ABC transporter solute-binding protein, Zn/Mn family [Marinicrinis lubricantis]|uniref:Metal ABC transporter solute-binding protein, Zn/Mn family n=1 Tax=Marinicrinis lubricantis TaxID=2086470 RepID=A0ABW1IRP0_9BACL
MKKVTGFIVLIMMMIALAGCGDDSKFTLEEGKTNVVTTFYPVYFLASEIGGDYAHVINLVPAGVEPHDWTPKSQDLVNMKKADMFVYNGAGFEGWVEDFLSSLDASEDLSIIEATKGADLIHTDEEEGSEEAHDHEEGAAGEDEAAHDHEEEAAEEEHGHSHDHGVDPHVWMSPVQMKTMAQNVYDGFVAADPEHQVVYKENLDQLVAELNTLDQQYRDVVDAASRKELVVSHQAYTYLAREYGLTQIGVMGLSPEAEPTAQDIKKVSDFIKEHDVKYILFEELVSPEIAQMLANDLDIESLVFNPLEGLSEEQEKAGEDYISLMKSNLTSLEKALQ